MQSRYYDPEVGRFLNADDTGMLGMTDLVLGNNLFAYCENNPVIGYDPSGYANRDTVIKMLKKVLERILEFAEKIVEFILDNFSVSSKKYIKMASNGKTPQAIYTFVYKNKSSIKSLNNNISSIGKFLSIVINITELTSILCKNVSYVKAVAEILFDGFIKLFTFSSSKFGAWLITTICKPLKIARKLIESILRMVIEDFFDKSQTVSRVKVTYLKYINCKKISFSNYVYALFKGVLQCA